MPISIAGFERGQQRHRSNPDIGFFIRNWCDVLLLLPGAGAVFESGLKSVRVACACECAFAGYTGKQSYPAGYAGHKNKRGILAPFFKGPCLIDTSQRAGIAILVPAVSKAVARDLQLAVGSGLLLD